jgi:dihydropteroate synthase
MITRKNYEWRLKSRTFLLGDKTLVFGLLPVAPDAPGGYPELDRAVARAAELEEQGAAVIEIAGEEYRPGLKPVSEAEEIRRVIPLVKRLRDHIAAPVSVRTWKSAVAEKALALGVEAIHDISGLSWNPDLAKIAVQADAGLILNHLRGTPEAWSTPVAVKDIVEQTATGLQAAAHRANRGNVDRKRILVDAGLGLGKRREHNIELVARLQMLQQVGLPVVVGPSRMAFLAKTEEAENDFARAGAVTAAVLAGAHVVMLDDLTALRQAVLLADELLAARPFVTPEPIAQKRRADGGPVEDRPRSRDFRMNEPGRTGPVTPRLRAKTAPPE